MCHKIDINDIKEYTPYREGRHSKFTSSENNCTHIGINENRNKVRQFKVDGEVIQANEPISRCDYLLLNDEKRTSYYIELKGSNLDKAIQQIENTISMISSSLPNYIIYRRIIYRTYSLDTRHSNVTIWKRKYKDSAIIKNGKLEERI